MNSRQRRTLKATFAKPSPTTVRWTDVESLLRTLGEVAEGEGSRVRVQVKGIRMVLHEPHPRPELGRKTLSDIRDFLIRAGVEPEGAYCGPE